MSGILRRSVYGVGAVVVVVLVTAWSPVFGDDDDDELARKVDALARRIEKLETALGARAGDSSKPPLTDRVATLEKGLGELSRASGQPKWSSPDSNLRELRRTLEAAERQRNELGGRLGRLERDLHEASECAREIREAKTRIENVRTSLRELESRVRRLESKP
jgi:chromosome segregation ATPase